MTRNQKLTKVIAGRTVKAVSPAPGGVRILFDDQSSMTIKTTSAAAVLSPDGKVKSVYETMDQFKIEFEDGSSVTWELANPGSSVAVRDRNNAVEYLG